MSELNPYLLYTAALVVSAVISMYAVKKIIFITRSKRIFDVPDNIRKIHGAEIPSLGGIGIFTGYVVAAAFFMYQKNWNFVFVSSVLLFFTGIYDDLANMRPSKKLLLQLIASAVTVYFADIRITSLHGLFGVSELSYWGSVVLTTLCCTFYINVFNFMDGIDGLACGLSILYAGLFGCLFAAMHETALACITFSMLGATIGLLVYNVAPAKIYMGDTGSMVLGFTLFLFSVLFVNIYAAGGGEQLRSMIHSAQGAYSISLAIIFIPVYDAVRVFILRAMKGISPLKADRRHLHYYLLDAGYGHSRSVVVILCLCLMIIAATYLGQNMPVMVNLAMMIVAAAVAVMAITRIRRSRMK